MGSDEIVDSITDHDASSRTAGVMMTGGHGCDYGAAESTLIFEQWNQLNLN